MPIDQRPTQANCRQIPAATKLRNRFQANSSRGRTHPVFVEVLRGRQELLQQGDHDDHDDHDDDNDNSDEQMEKIYAR